MPPGRRATSPRSVSPCTVAELLRVCRPGGVIALANWTPEGFIGELLRTVARHVPPPADRASPLRWGDPRFLTQIFGDAATITHLRRRDFVFRYASAEAFVDFFREWYGPTHRAFAALPPEARPALAADVATLARKYDRSTAPWLEAHGEYLEVVLQRAG
jgi:SAM-dependent methyltransferase